MFCLPVAYLHYPNCQEKEKNMFGSFILQFPAGHKVMWHTDVVVMLIVTDMEVFIAGIDLCKCCQLISFLLHYRVAASA